VPEAKRAVNLARYFHVGRADGERYLETLAAATDSRDGVAVLDRYCRPITNRGNATPA